MPNCDETSEPIFAVVESPRFWLMFFNCLTKWSWEARRFQDARTQPEPPRRMEKLARYRGVLLVSGTIAVC